MDYTDASLVVFLIGLLTAFGQMIKQSTGLKPEIIPLINCAVGVVIAVGWTAATRTIASGELAIAAMSGLVAGLSSAHLYDAVHVVRTEAVRKEDVTVPPHEVAMVTVRARPAVHYCPNCLTEFQPVAPSVEAVSA